MNLERRLQGLKSRFLDGLLRPTESNQSDLLLLPFPSCKLEVLTTRATRTLIRRTTDPYRCTQVATTSKTHSRVGGWAQGESNNVFTCKSRARIFIGKVHFFGFKPAAQVCLSGIVRLASATHSLTTPAMCLAKIASLAVVITFHISCPHTL